MKKTHQNDNTNNSNNRVAIIKKSVNTTVCTYTHKVSERKKKAKQNSNGKQNKTKNLLKRNEKFCTGRDSNSDRPRGRRAFYP